jgi:hypothetical protein
MRTWMLAGGLALSLAIGGCGSSDKKVDTANYTCAQFQKSLQTKGDNSAGNFINQLAKQASLKQPTKTARREVSLGIYFACRGQSGSVKPAVKATAIAQRIEAGKFKLPAPQKKKSGK